MKVQVWIVLDENHDYSCDIAKAEVLARYAEEHGDEEAAKRIICVTVNIQAPGPLELSCGCPPEMSGEATAELATV
jgi:hypothetical protein